MTSWTQSVAAGSSASAASVNEMITAMYNEQLRRGLTPNKAPNVDQGELDCATDWNALVSMIQAVDPFFMESATAGYSVTDDLAISLRAKINALESEFI